MTATPTTAGRGEQESSRYEGSNYWPDADRRSPTLRSHGMQHPISMAALSAQWIPEISRQTVLHVTKRRVRRRSLSAALPAQPLAEFEGTY